jgi:hypothetical protein
MRTMLVCLLLPAIGCVQVKVATEVAPGADFTRFETYAQVMSPLENPVVGETIRSEIDQQLTAKGYRAVSVANADMVVTFRASGEPRSRRRDAGDPDANYYVVHEYIAGTLVIDVFDVLGKQLVWHGVGNVDVPSDRNPQRAAAQAVEVVLAKFPSRT